MVGRPRKMGKRGKTGRLIQAYHNPRAQVASQPHRAAMGLVAEWPEAGTAFGRLMLHGFLTPAQHAAGERYAELYASARAAIGGPSPDPRAMNYEHSISGISQGMADPAAQKADKAYVAAFNAIREIRWQIAVMHHAVHDRPVSDIHERSWLTCGLDRLVAHFGIDPKLQITTASAKYKLRTVS